MSLPGKFGRYEVLDVLGSEPVIMMTPRRLLQYEEQATLRPGRALSRGDRVPSRFVRVRTRSEPAGAGVRVGSSPVVPLPFDGRVAAGEYRFEFIWRGGRELVEATIDGDGPQIAGRRQLP
jgi:hypothetical protein